jgi:hypothetical protein
MTNNQDFDLFKCLVSDVGRAGLEPATNGLPTRRFGWFRL